MNYLIEKNRPIPLHVSHPIRVVGKDGTIYHFTCDDHANDIIERYNIDVVDIGQTPVRVEETTTQKPQKRTYRRKVKV